MLTPLSATSIPLVIENGRVLSAADLTSMPPWPGDYTIAVMPSAFRVDLNGAPETGAILQVRYRRAGQ